MSTNLRDVLESRVLIGDGAIGTLLHDRGVGYDHPYSRANLTHPELVFSIHEEYLSAGAGLVETNTFAADRLRLSSHNLEDSTREINTAGARLARQTVDAAANGGEKALVLGAIGPLGRSLEPVGSLTRDEAREVFLEQAEALLEGGADAILLETFTDVNELRLAFETVKPLGAPVLAYKTFVEDGETLAEGLPARVAREVSGWDVEIFGANCTVGPQRMLGIVEQMSDAAGPVAAFPNPGLPQLIDGQIRYRQDVDHFALYGKKLAEAGARLIGGCCGTTPAHVRALSEALKDFVPEKKVARNTNVAFERNKAEVQAEPDSDFAQKLETGFAVTVEVDLAARPRHLGSGRGFETAQGTRCGRHRHLRRGEGPAADAPGRGSPDRAGAGRNRSCGPHLLPR